MNILECIIDALVFLMELIIWKIRNKKKNNSLKINKKYFIDSPFWEVYIKYLYHI